MQSNNLKAVVFDAFGTVVKPVVRSAGYRKLFSQAKDLRFARNMALTKDLDLSGLADLLGVPRPSLSDMDLLEAEAEAVELYDDTLITIERLHDMGYNVAICSNLAAPYGPAVRRLLSNVDEFVFSYEVGFLKPEQGIYDAVCN